MQAREGDEENRRRGQPLGLSAVQGLPWWGGVGQQATLQPATSSPLFAEYSNGVAPALRRPLSSAHARSFQQPSAPVLVQTAAEGQGPSLVAARILPLPSSGYDEGRLDEQRQYSAAPAVISHLPGEYILPHTQLELGHSLALAAYPYADPYFGSFAAAYGAQAMIHPHMQGVQQARMPLPSEMTEEEPVYVNAKQYHGILRRRQSRAKAESENRLIKTRKPYLHESRHLHAMRRARGCGGRFLNTKSKNESKSSADGNVSSSGQSSQEGTTSDSFETRLEPSLIGSPNQVTPTVQGLSDHLMVGMGLSVVNGAGCHPGMFSHVSHPMMSSGTGHGNYHNHLNQGFHSSVFHPLPSGSNEGDSGQGGGIMSTGSQQRAVATQ